MIDYAKENFSAKQSSAGEDARVQNSYGDQERSSSAEEAAGQGAQATDSGALLKSRRLSSKDERLQNSTQFRLVYEAGSRYDGPLMSIFVLRNALGVHRFGVTASRKLSHSAVKRNRAKRLLREMFRLSGGDLGMLRYNYDWVFNARRAILKVKVAGPLKYFNEVVARVCKDEYENS